MTQLNLTLVHPTTNEQVPVRLPDDASMERLLPVLVSRLNLPANDGPAVITYYLDHKLTGRMLSGTDTLAGAGVRDGDVLRLGSVWPSSILAPELPNPSKEARQVFIAYSYRLYPKADYRKVFNELAEAFKVDFIFADEKITNLHILQKILNYIRSSRFGIYDISGWNANVTLELGLAFGLNERAYIAIDPSKTDVNEVPSDLRGIDRIQYTSYAELQEGLAKLLAQELPVAPAHDVENQLVQLRKQTVELTKDADGLKVSDIAELLGISVDMAKLVIRPMVNRELEMRGNTRAARYYLKQP